MCQCLFLVHDLPYRFYAWNLADVCYGAYHLLNAMHHDHYLAVNDTVNGTYAQGIHVEVQPVGNLGSKVHEQAMSVYTGNFQCDGVGESDAVYGY